MKAKYVREEQVFQPKNLDDILTEYVAQYVGYNFNDWFGNFFDTLQRKGFSYETISENEKKIIDTISKSIQNSLAKAIKTITAAKSKYTLKSTIERENIGYGEMASTTTWELYDSKGKLVKTHSQFSRDDDRFKDWKAYVRSLGINPKEVEKI